MMLLPALTAALLAVPAPAQEAKPLSLFLHAHDWALELSAPGFAVDAMDLSPDGKRASARARGGPGQERFGLSAYVEVVPGLKDAKGCRAYYNKRQDEMAKKTAGEVKTTRRKSSEKGKQARSEYFIEEYGGRRVHQKHVNAFLRKDDACIDVHLSALEYEAADAKVFEQVLMSLRWGKPGSRGPAWASTMLKAAMLGQRGDAQGAIAAYRATRDAALKDPKTTDMDMAQIDRALGGTYLEVDDAKNADIALRSAVRVLRDDPSVWFNLACSSSMLGRMDDAERALRSCYAEAQPLGRLDHFLTSTMKDPQLAAFRKSPQFQSLSAGPR